MQRRGLWLGLGLSVLAALLWPFAYANADECSLTTAELRVTMQGDRLSVPVSINGQQTHLWLDSGAFFSLMSKESAKEFALPLKPVPPWFIISGIGGTSDVELGTVKSFGFLNRTINNMDFFVGGSDPGNGLIGRNILALADTEFDLANGSVKIIVPHSCDKSNMAYWAEGKPYFTVPLVPTRNPRDHTFIIPLTINGVMVEAMMDTGSPDSSITRTIAELAGIKLKGPDAVPFVIGGVGRNLVKGWAVPVAKVKIGDEQILNTHMDVLEDGGHDSRAIPMMLLGEDFFMAHHIYVARKQGLVYFTYSGGRPFNTAPPASPNASPGVTVAQPPKPHVIAPGLRPVEVVASNRGDPQSAEAFARRGAARLSANEPAQALGDLDQAIHLSPQDAGFYAMRARIQSNLGRKDMALADFDKSLSLDPTNREVLVFRAEERLAAKDEKGAFADAKAASSLTPPGSLASAEIADLFVSVHQPASAIPLLDNVIDEHSEDSDFKRLLYKRCRARVLADLDLDEALIDCNHVVHDRAAVVFDSRGLLYFRKGNFTAAIADYNAALKLDPKLAWSLYMRGQAKIALAQIDSGKADQAAARVIQSDIAQDVAAYGITGAKAP